MTRKLTGLFLVLSLCLGMLAGCGGGTADAGASGGGTSAEAGEPEVNENAAGDGEKLVVFATNWIIKENDRIDTYKEIIREKFGKELEIINPPFEESAEKLNIMLSSGEQIDVIWKSTPGGMLELAEKGYLVPLDDMLSASEELVPEKWSGWDYLDSVTYDGSVYALPLQKATGYIPTINQAWLDELGLPVPATLDELTSTLRAFKEAGLGGDATIPLAHQWSYSDHVASFLGMWGLEGPNVMLDENGKRYHPWLTESAAEGLTWMQEMYSEGILDSEFPTAQEEPMRQKVINGMVGVFMDWPGANHDMNTKAAANGTKSNMVAMEQIAASSDVTAVTPGNTICMWMVPKTSPDPQAAFDLIEYWYTEEGAQQFSLQEGFDYTVADGEKIGDPTNGNFFVEVSKTGTLVKAIEAVGLDATEEGLLGAEVLDKQIKFPGPLPGASAVADIAQPLVLQCIIGEISVEDFQSQLQEELLAKEYIDA